MNMPRIHLAVCVVLLALAQAAQGAEHHVFAHTGDDQFVEENVGKRVKAAWSNMGSWLFVANAETAPDAAPDMILVMSFDESYEDLGQGGTRERLAEGFMRLINAKADEDIRLGNVRNDGYVVTLEYQDGWTVAWDYRHRLPAELFRAGKRRAPHGHDPRKTTGNSRLTR